MKPLKFLQFSELARASSFLFAGGILAGVLGYAFQIVVGRLLTVFEFGLFASIMALVTIINAPVSALTIIISKQVSKLRATENKGAILFYCKQLKRNSIAAVLFVCGCALMLSSPISSLLELHHAFDFVVVVALVALSIPYAVGLGALQGMQHFVTYSLTGILSVTAKLLASVLLISFGLGYLGALAGGIIGLLLVIAFVWVSIFRSLKFQELETKKIRALSLRSYLPIFAVNMSSVAISQSDLVIAKYVFSGDQVGFFAAAAVLGKAVLYLPGSIALAIFPMVSENFHRGKNDMQLLVQGLGMTLLLCLAAAAVYFVLDELIITMFFGSNYGPASAVLKLYGLAMVPFAIALILERFLLARDVFYFAYISAGVVFLQIWTLMNFASELTHFPIIIGCFGAAYMSLLFLISVRVSQRN